ncbi:MAG TPA: hypothetical protein VK778_02270 [Solirubrobacteraceae bacterium]|jgi:hypothetical protein|nr:hypothetical protein [Solirubrobacteraceae bacterium]
MDSSTPTEELAIGDAPEPVSTASTELHHLTSAASRQGCAACGAAMAADQRYCVECGERRGAPRVSLLEGPARRPRESTPQSAPSQRRRIATVNSTLISIIGMLLLAVGVGVLIGRSGDTTVKSPPAQVVTISGAPSTGAAATTPATSTGATTASESSATKAKSKASAKTKPAASKVPLPKAVKVGTPGHGRGYQNGHFTGNFFGE